jgi:hypothetical protein
MSVDGVKVVTARGVSSPLSNIDLGMNDRVMPGKYYFQPIYERDRDIRKQERYTKGLDSYNEPWVQEGHYWRAQEQEPYSWYDREDDSPYGNIERPTLFQN